MKPTDVLKAEHRVIEQVLDCLERMAAEASARGQLEGESAREALAFFRAFADKCHHGKEETHLFPAMEARGFPRQGGPTGVMLAEHEQGRACVRGMAEVLEAAAGGDRSAVGRFVTHARQYVDLLRAHIEKEDHVLFTMANQAFSEEDQRRLLAEFEKVESEVMGAGEHEAYLEIAHRLADRYGVPRAETTGGAAHGCGH